MVKVNPERSSWEVLAIVKLTPLLAMGFRCEKLSVMANLHPEKLFLTPTFFFVILISIFEGKC